MSIPKIYTSEQFEQEEQMNQCPRCHEQQSIYIELSCGHKYCIVCTTFAFLKYKNQLHNQNKIKCLQCQQLSQLDESLHALISQVINKQLGPIVKNQTQNNQSRMSINQTQLQINRTNIQYTNTSKRNTHKLKSQDQMINNGGLTPTKNSKYFYSKCQSPKTSSIVNQDSCLIHPTQQISYFCMTCSIKPLCYKCIKSNKHNMHDVKILKRGIQIVNEKFSLLALQTGQKIQNIQLYQKRLNDRKQIFQQRIQKSIKQIKGIFLSLQRKIIQKSKQIIDQYQQFYNQKLQQIQSRVEQSRKMLKQIKGFQQKLKQFINNNEISNSRANNNKNTTPINTNNQTIIKPLKIIQSYQQIQSKRKELFQNQKSQLNLFKHNKNYHQNIFDSINCQNSSLILNITKINQYLDNITIHNINQNNKPQDLFNYTGKYQNLCDRNNQIQKYIHHQKERFNQTIPYTSIMKSDILFNKNKTMALRNCSSRQKLHKYQQNNSKYPDINRHFIVQQNFAKRIKTNVPASLNTSRDKRDKKHTTKTQQDERRFKSKANYKTQLNTHIKNINTIQQKNQKPFNANKLQSAVPSYITKHIQKHNQINNDKNSRKVSPFNNNGTVYLMQNIQSSKNTSKIISKTSNILYSDEMNNRKKNNKQHFTIQINNYNKKEDNKQKDKKHMIKSAKNSQGLKRKK